MTRSGGRWLGTVASAVVLAGVGEQPGNAAAQPSASTAQSRAVDVPTPPAAAPASIPLLNPQDELLLEVRTRDWILTDAFAGYSTARGSYLPLGDFARLLDLAIAVDPAAGRGEGWFLDEARTFRIDVGAGFVETPKGRTALRPEDAIVANGDIYVRADLIGQWFPVDVELILAKQQILLTLREKFPFEAKISREQAREGLGWKRNTRINYPREETLYEMLAAPALDVNIRAAGGVRADLQSQYDVRASGDLAWMNTDLFFGGSKDKLLGSARLTMRRRDPDGKLLGPLGLTLIEFGDTSTLSQPIGMRSATGRGFVLGNAPLDQGSVFDRIDLRGELPLGYEVELYRNDVLIGSADRAVDGRYEFLQVPLEFGLNVMRLLFYGPRGERREEVQQINAGEGRLGSGEFHYTVSAVQQDKQLLPFGQAEGTPGGTSRGDLLAGATVEYGINAGITALASGSTFTADGERINQGLVGLRTSLFGAAIQADGAFQGKGAWALQSGVAGRTFGASFVLQHLEFGGNFIDQVRGGAGARRLTQVRLDRSFKLSRQLVATNLLMQRTQGRDGNVELTGALRTSTSLFRWVASNVLNYRQFGSGAGSRTIDGAIEANGLIGAWGVRAGLGYLVKPRSQFRDLTLTFDRELSPGMLFRGGVTQQLTHDRSTSLVASLARRVGVFDIAADGQYDTSSKSLLLGMRVSFSVGKGARHWGFRAAGLARGGSMLALAFRDMDGDGVKDSDEAALAGIGFRGGAGEVRTNERGMALITGLGDGRPAQVSVMLETLSDPFLAPVKAGIEVVPRPGRTHSTVFPIATVSEVEGKAFFQQGDTERPVANVQLQLADKNGDVVASTRTEYDGFFLFDRVAPGAYVLRLDPDQAKKLQIRMLSEPQVRTNADGGLVGDLKVALVRI